MNASTSEYSSGCESGWTTYLDQYSNSDTYYSRGFYTNYEGKCINDDDGEDLSMVSDASSAPRNSTYYSYAPEEKKKSKGKGKSTRKEPKEQNLCLDDTASSSVFHFSRDNVPPSHDHDSVYSAAHFQGESLTKKRLSFFKSSTKGKSSGNLVGRKRQ